MLRSCSCLLVVFVLASSVRAAYEDARCKCVCVDHSVPKVSNESSTEPKRSVYVKFIPSDKCTCSIMLEDKADLCPYCDCKYQVRNTATIKPFLASRGRSNFLNSVHPTSSSQSKAVPTFRNYMMPSHGTAEYSDLNTHGDGGEGPSSSREANAVVNRARDSQSRWKGRVEAQRDRVFNERTILN